MNSRASFKEAMEFQIRLELELSKLSINFKLIIIIIILILSLFLTELLLNQPRFPFNCRYFILLTNENLHLYCVDAMLRPGLLKRRIFYNKHVDKAG